MRTITNGVPRYTGENLEYIAYPMGGLGAGMFCIQGTGMPGSFSVRNEPALINEPAMFAALHINGGVTRVLEGPVPKNKYFGAGVTDPNGRGAGCFTSRYGLPRCTSAEFSSRFPFADIELMDKHIPLKMSITAWSPFIPLNADDSSLPVAALEYSFTNDTQKSVDAVFSFSTDNPMRVNQGEKDTSRVYPAENGFVCYQPPLDGEPWQEGAFSVTADGGDVCINTAWYRGGWFDPYTMLWNDIEKGVCVNKSYSESERQSIGGSLSVPLKLEPGETKTVTLRFSWYVPETNLKCGTPDPSEPVPEGFVETHKPWYSGRFSDIASVNAYWSSNYKRLRDETKKFTDTFYDTDMPSEALEAVAANLTILKSPTVLRQADGRLWCWEGSFESSGSCHGSCTHVWNYAQAVSHLFPDLERTLRETEFLVSQNADGRQMFRSTLPIRKSVMDFHAASDGQLGGIIKLWRDYTICGDLEWLRSMWAAAKQSMDYCVSTWDPEHTGVLVEPHHNTYDIEFWGPDGMCSSFYMAALKAMSLMAEAVGEDAAVYAEAYEKSRAKVESELFNGEYFIQKVMLDGLRASVNRESLLPEELELLDSEGPKYQYGDGCLSDGVLGSWMSLVCGAGDVLDGEKLDSHLKSVLKYNYRKDLSEHTNLQRSTYALGDEGGLLLCTWPKGNKLSLPFVYSDEVWTGIEYQVATHLIMRGFTDEGMTIIRTVRSRYDGTVRNPYNEYECGNWYARALASYACVQAFSGAVYNAADRTLCISKHPAECKKSFFITATGYGTLTEDGGNASVKTVSGSIDIGSILMKDGAKL